MKILRGPAAVKVSLFQYPLGNWEGEKDDELEPEY